MIRAGSRSYSTGPNAHPLSLRAMESFEGLRVLQVTRELAEEVIAAVAEFPRHDPARLRSQLAEAAESVSSNIAEGVGRSSLGERLQFFRVARGSLEETKNHLKVCANTGRLRRRTFYRLWNRSVVSSRMLASLMANLERRRRKPPPP